MSDPVRGLVSSWQDVDLHSLLWIILDAVTAVSVLSLAVGVAVGLAYRVGVALHRRWRDRHPLP